MWSVQKTAANPARSLAREVCACRACPCACRRKCPVCLQVTAQTRAEAAVRQQLAAMVRHRCRSWCKALRYTPRMQTCFDLDNAIIEHGSPRHYRFVRSFLYSYYWPREPTVNNSWMSINSPYLHVQTERYCLSGDRLIAYQLEPRTKECKMVGVLVANKIMPWTVDELDEWAQMLEGCEPEQTRVAFQAHCIREPGLINKYHVPYLYDLEVIATASEVTGLGLANMLLRMAIMRAMEARHPLVTILAKSVYVAKLCDRLGLEKEWSMKYTDFKDYLGRPRFFNRSPQGTVSLYSRRFNPAERFGGGVPDICDSPRIQEVFAKICTQKHEPAEKRRVNFTRENMQYSDLPVKQDRERYRTCTCTCYKNVFQKTFLSECPRACYRDPTTKIRPCNFKCPNP